MFRHVAPLHFGAMLLVTVLSSAPMSVWAAPRPVVAVQPCDRQGHFVARVSYFIAHAHPGQKRRLYACLSNRGGRAVTVNIAPVDAARDTQGNVSYRLASDPRRGVGRWVTLFAHTVYLRRHESLVLPFDLHVPRHTHTGSYLGALTVFVPVRKPKDGAGAVVLVQVRLAVAIMVLVQPAARSTGG